MNELRLINKSIEACTARDSIRCSFSVFYIVPLCNVLFANLFCSVFDRFALNENGLLNEAEKFTPYQLGE